MTRNNDTQSEQNRNITNGAIFNHGDRHTEKEKWYQTRKEQRSKVNQYKNSTTISTKSCGMSGK